MAPPRKDVCDCGVLERMADEPKFPIEFDAALNEYHITCGDGGHAMIYYCPFCGGSTPKSKRDRLFHRITDAEKVRLSELTKDMRTIQDVTAALGEPDISQPIGVVSTSPERDGKPETTQTYRAMVYTKLSDIADVHVTVYPTDKVAIQFQGKAVKKNPT